MNQKTLFALVTGVLILSACGQKEKKNAPDDELVQYPLVLEADIVDSYPLADETCQSTSDQISVSKANLTTLTPVRKSLPVIAVNEKSISGVRSENGLKNSIVMRTSFGEFWDRVCPWSLNNQGRLCTDPVNPSRAQSWTLKNEQKPLKVCNSIALYARRTQEQAAIQSLNAIERAHQMFQKLGNPSVKPITLQIFPKFRTLFTKTPEVDGRIVNKASFLASNLVYFPADKTGNGGSIAVLPERRVDSVVERPALWESEFASAHEFGHHIQRMQIYGRSLLNASMQWDPVLHSFTNPSEHRAFFGPVGTDTIFAESFADLTAYYALEQNAQLVESLPCFGFNRSPIQESYYNGTPKRLTHSILNSFEQSASQAASAPHPLLQQNLDACSQPNWASAHDLSAILSFNLNLLFESIAQQIRSVSSHGGDELKYRMTISWSENVLKNVEKRSQEKKPVASTREMFELILGIAEQTVLDLSKDQFGVIPDLNAWCQSRKTGFPALKHEESPAGCR